LKRLVFCFDGTWNKLSAPHSTNVVIVAQSVTPLAGKTVQIIHYDSGVGTGVDDRWKGGLFGEGLIDKIVDAYTFLIFNYDPGDELFIFGFSRGAFTARAFVGFVRSLGIMQRRHATRIAEAVKLYQARTAASGHDTEELLRFRYECSPEVCVDLEEVAWRVENCAGYSTGKSLVARIKYLGVWDTVGAIGVPTDVFFSKWANEGEQYFDTELSTMVVSGRHAVSIDEQRTTFKPTLWPNFQALNGSLGFNPAASDAPYQQRWFPGDHGSVGGGGDVRGLSDGALAWVLEGAKRMGLVMDSDEKSPLYTVLPNPFASLSNMEAADRTIGSDIEAMLPKASRTNGPTAIEEVSASAIQRWNATATQLSEGRPYRPKTLEAVATAIADAAGPPKPQAEHPVTTVVAADRPTAGKLYKILYGDELRKIALEAYGSVTQVVAIKDANPLIEDINQIFVGQVIYLPPA
jgi:uncharacterized protein (DUF2235 family)